MKERIDEKLILPEKAAPFIEYIKIISRKFYNVVLISYFTFFLAFQVWLQEMIKQPMWVGLKWHEGITEWLWGDGTSTNTSRKW